MGSFGQLGDFVCVKLKDRLRVGHGDSGGVEKRNFDSIVRLLVAVVCTVKVMTSQFKTVRIQAVKESETNNS